MESTMLRLYDSRLSGNSWKIRILLSQLGLAYDRVTLDLQKGEAREPAFRQISRFARVPVLVLDDGRPIVESGAILLHLAQGTPYLPDDTYLRTEVMGWLFFEQADLQKVLAVPRVLHLHGLAQERQQDIERLHADGYAGLEKLDQWLREHIWLVGPHYTVADLALSVYVSLADQGGYDMTRFAGIRDWLVRVHDQRGWVPLIPEAGQTAGR
jgi:glutathione S-transferase